MSVAPQKSVYSEVERFALAALIAASIHPVARVLDRDRVTDLAISLCPTRLAVVRCLDEASTDDHTALATMISEGDFVWAGLVYSDQLGTDWPGDVEAFHLSELSRLVERLQELKRSATL